MFDLKSYGAVFGTLIGAAEICPLGPGKPVLQPINRLKTLHLPAAFAPHYVENEGMAQACLAGLYLLFNDLDASHRISQDLNNSTGSFWHGIMHRREPDFTNAKYWFRQVGRHPIYEPLAELAAQAARENPHPAADFLTRQGKWNPHDFVDLCEQAGHNGCDDLCRTIQQREWELLFDYSFRQAIDEG